MQRTHVNQVMGVSRARALAVSAGLFGAWIGSTPSALSQPSGPPATPSPAPAPSAPAEKKPISDSGLGSASPVVTPVVAPVMVPSATAVAPKAPPLTELGARGLVRVALTDLRVNPSPTTEDYRIALALLRRAMRLLPKDLELVRLAADAAEQAGDSASVVELTRRILELDPDDTVSQLSLISARINDLQDINSRLEAYDNFLGPKGRSLDASVRSRLALDAAMLHRERGDVQGFAKRLTEATQLDVTNKDAAAVAYAFYSTRMTDEEGRLELLINLLNADPLDRATHLEIARLLASVGACKESLRFYSNVMAIDQVVGDRASLEVATERAMITWETNGPAEMLKGLNQAVRDTRLEIESLRRQLKEANRSLEGVPEASSVRLDLSSERLRLLGAASIGDEVLLAEAATDLAASVAALDDYIAKPETAPKRLTPELVLHLRDLWRVDGPFLLLVVGRDIEGAAESIRKLKLNEDQPLAPGTEARLNGWLKLRQGDLDGAQAEFRKAEPDDAGVALGLAMLAELRGDNAAASQRYASVWRGAADSSLGAYARQLAMTLDGVAPPPAELGRRLGEVAQGIPKWVDDVAVNPKAFMNLSIEAGNLFVGALDPISITLRIRNTATVPLGVGDGRPLNSQILLAPGVQIGPASERGFAEVVRMDRRLRLLPREELAVTVWADPGYGGWLLENLSGLSTRLSFRALQGFVSTGGTTRQGPRCLAVDARQVVRESVRGVQGPLDDLIATIQTGKDALWANAIAAAQVRLRTFGAADGISEADAARLAAALGQRYRSEGPAGRLFMLVRVPNIKAADAFNVIVKAEPESDETVQLATIITRCADMGDPLLKKLREGPPGAVRQVAELHHQRLTAGAKGFATMVSVRLESGAASTSGDEAAPVPNK